MNTSSAITTAMLRGIYVAIGSGLTAGLMAMQQGVDDRGSLIIGLLSGLVALGFRAGGEGIYDQHRDDTGDTRGQMWSQNSHDAVVEEVSESPTLGPKVSP